MKELFISPLCIDSRNLMEKENFKEDYQDAEIIDITASMENLKRFLQYRDHDPAFQEIKERGNIGIPCLIINKKEVSFL